jgi:hypothetical protein
MGTVRYALAGSPESPELVVQFARGRGGQAVIENYDLDIDTGKATGHIVAFQQVQVPGSRRASRDFCGGIMAEAAGIAVVREFG